VLDNTALTGKRQLLVESAARVFAQRGFTATRVADIAAAAGVGKGTVYEYFSSKEELFFAVFEWIDDRIRRRVGAAVAEPGSAREQLRAMVVESALIVSEHREVFSLNLDFWAASRGSAFEPRFTEACRSIYQKYRGIVSGLIRRGQADGEFGAQLDADGLAVVIVSALDGLGVQCWFDDAIDPRAAAESFAEALCDGLCREGR
jgi:AcrR family transcriptional regulator